MRRNEEPSGPPNEDVLTIPKSWCEHIHPRRGGIPGPALEPEPLELAAAYDGADPVKAARNAFFHVRGQSSLYRIVDTWIRDHGIPFAAAATVELERAHRRPGDDVSRARQIACSRMRRHLAAASNADYAGAVQSMAPRRVDFGTRLVSSFIAPTEAAWVDEACAMYHQAFRSNWDSMLLACSLSTPRQLAMLGPQVVITGTLGFDELVTLIEGLGAAALPAIEDAMDADRWLDTGVRRGCYDITALLPTDEAFEALATRLDHKHAAGAIVRAMERFPVRALRVLAKTANGGTEAAPAARKLLSAHVRTHIDLIDAVVAAVPEGDARLISELASQTAGLPEASADELPPLLVVPPWTRKRIKPAAPTMVAGLEPPHVRRLEWAEGERETWAAQNVYLRWNSDWDEVASRYSAGDIGHFLEARNFFANAPEDLARPLIPKWKPEFRSGDNYDALAQIVARFGQDALDLAVDAVPATKPTAGSRFVEPLVDPVVARLMADWLTRVKPGRARAASWLIRHAESAAVFLVPDAVGEPGNRRVAAETALRFLAPLTDVRAAARHYGPQAQAAVDAILAFDPLSLYPSRMPTFPAWLGQTVLPQILLRGRERALPAASVQHVLSMLAISKPGAPYGGITVVRELADARSLADFAWELFDGWRFVDMPSRDSWAMTALAWFGDDDTARRLAQLIRAWPGQGAHPRAVAGLDVLAEMGTDAALMQLHHISQKVKFKALKSRAQEKIAEIARTLDLTADQLGDRLVPDFGLDADGTMWLDYGPRSFRVGFDEQLAPVVIADEKGVLRKSLPVPNSKDDAELAAAARSHFSGLKKDVRTVAGDVIRRLESAMVTGRSWQATEFRALLLDHPLIRHLTRRLVWLSSATEDADPSAGTVTAFRVAEDGTLATVADEPYLLPDDAVVRIAHPLRLGDGLGAWAELFADHEILQPFEQLGRAVYALTEQERGEGRLTRFEGAGNVPVGKILGLVAQGWQRGTPMDGGVENTIARKLNENLYVIIDLEPGIAVGIPHELGDQTLSGVYLSKRPTNNRGGQHDADVLLSALDPVTASEVLRTLTHLTN